MDGFRAHSLFQPSDFAAAIGGRRDERDESPAHVFGAVLGIPHTQLARVIAILGFDFIFVDALHTAINPENLAAIIQTINFTSEGKTCAIVRVPSPDSDCLTYALDAGAAGIIFPQVESAEEAAKAVRKVRYAYSGGDRSLSPIALLNGITDSAPPGWTPETIADRNIAVICQIESMKGIENVNEIAQTPGVNGLMLGSGDLRASLGLPLRNPPGHIEHPSFFAAVEKLIKASKDHSMPLMVPAFRTDPETMDWLRNFKMILMCADVLTIVKAQRQDLLSMKGALSKQPNGVNGAKEPNGMREGKVAKELNGISGDNGVDEVKAYDGMNEANGVSTRLIGLHDMVRA